MHGVGGLLFGSALWKVSIPVDVGVQCDLLSDPTRAGMRRKWIECVNAWNEEELGNAILAARLAAANAVAAFPTAGAAEIKHDP